MSIDLLNFIAQFVTISGYIVGLGAVTVIDLHGFLAQKSPYWTRATISAHKITKPLIWIGTILALNGSLLNYYLNPTQLHKIHSLIFLPLILNGIFLSFVVSPYLLNQEKEDKSEELLPSSLQLKIRLSFVVSFIGWWGSLLLFVYMNTL